MIISNFTIPGQFTVQLSVDEDTSNARPYKVTYGHVEKEFHYSERALEEFQSCVNHASKCAGWVLDV
jgi:hypothetical protein